MMCQDVIADAELIIPQRGELDGLLKSQRERLCGALDVCVAIPVGRVSPPNLSTLNAP